MFRKLIVVALSVLSLLSLVHCGPPASISAEELVRDLPKYLGKRVTMRAKFRAGARCRQGDKGDWKTYCKDCQYCRGPVVVDIAVTTSTNAEDWPMILGGTWKGEDIRCKGPLHQIECYPFVPGKTYVVQGAIENQHPPKLLVDRFWDVE